ncbi:MAG: helix-turn-helix transcriptional regulator [Pseudoflavonifractor sp.]|nr:helix-turn-helix transcriptional regulator [Pseudoflavonifractor sp.]
MYYDNIEATFYERFKALCEKNDMSVSRAAMEIGLSNSTPTKWKKTGATPDSATLSKVSNYFGVSINQLLGTPILGSELMKIIRDESLRLRVPEEELVQIFLNRRADDIATLNKENISEYFDFVCTKNRPTPVSESGPIDSRDKEFLELFNRLTPDQKELLLVQLKVLKDRQ